MRLTQPRIPPLPQSEWNNDSDVQEMMATLKRDGQVFNIFSTLARHPALLRRWLVFGNHVLGKSTLPARERELAILRTGWLCRAEYEWGHHVAIGKDAGLSADEIKRVLRFPALITALEAGHRRPKMEVQNDLLGNESEQYFARHAVDPGRYMASKLITSFPANLREGSLPAVQALCVLFDGRTGRPLCVPPLAPSSAFFSLGSFFAITSAYTGSSRISRWKAIFSRSASSGWQSSAIWHAASTPSATTLTLSCMQLQASRRDNVCCNISRCIWTKVKASASAKPNSTISTKSWRWQPRSTTRR